LFSPHREVGSMWGHSLLANFHITKANAAESLRDWPHSRPICRHCAAARACRAIPRLPATVLAALQPPVPTARSAWPLHPRKHGLEHPARRAAVPPNSPTSSRMCHGGPSASDARLGRAHRSAPKLACGSCLDRSVQELPSQEQVYLPSSIALRVLREAFERGGCVANGHSSFLP
jgi:hypothetical protein